LAKQAITNSFKSIYKINYSIEVLINERLRPWSEVVIEKKINLLTLNYENESPFKHCAVEEIFKIYSKFLFNLNDNILRPVLNEFLYDGGAKKVYNFFGQ
jgi:hypothetical protein